MQRQYQQTKTLADGTQRTYTYTKTISGSGQRGRKPSIYTRVNRLVSSLSEEHAHIVLEMVEDYIEALEEATDSEDAEEEADI